jgi:hypothetical protein
MLVSEDVLFKQLEPLEKGLELEPDAHRFPVEVFQSKDFVVKGFIEHSPIMANGARVIRTDSEQRALEVQQLVFNRSVFEDAIDQVVHDHVDIELGIATQTLLEVVQAVATLDY